MNQPRVPSGSSHGGQFASVHGSASSAGSHTWKTYDGKTVTTEQAFAEASKAVNTPTLAARQYSSTYVGGATAAKASELYIQKGREGIYEHINSKGGPLDPRTGVMDGFAMESFAAAPVLVEGIRSAPITNATLFRGIKSDAPIADLEKLSTGDSVDFGRLTSFSNDRSQAAYYGGGKHSYEIRLEGSTRALSTDELTGMKHGEHITFGKFKVIGIEGPSAHKLPEAYVGRTKFKRTIVLKQEEVP